MDEPTARLAALIDAIDTLAADRIDTLDPAVALGLGTIIGAARNDPAWMLGQIGRASNVITALRWYVDTGGVPEDLLAEIPPILADAIATASVGDDGPAFGSFVGGAT